MGRLRRVSLGSLPARAFQPRTLHSAGGRASVAREPWALGAAPRFGTEAPQGSEPGTPGCARVGAVGDAGAPSCRGTGLGASQAWPFSACQVSRRPPPALGVPKSPGRWALATQGRAGGTAAGWEAWLAVGTRRQGTVTVLGEGEQETASRAGQGLSGALSEARLIKPLGTRVAKRSEVSLLESLASVLRSLGVEPTPYLPRVQ